MSSNPTEQRTESPLHIMSKSHRKGELSETRVGEALDVIKEDDEILDELGISRILRIRHATPNSDLDQRHTDFLVLIELKGKGEDLQKVPIPIQVKSSERKRREFERWMTQQGMPHIRSVSVRVKEKSEHILDKVVQCLRTAIEMFRNGSRRLFEGFNRFFDKPEATDKPARHPTSKEVRDLARRDRDSGYYNFAPIHRGDWAAKHTSLMHNCFRPSCRVS